MHEMLALVSHSIVANLLWPLQLGLATLLMTILAPLGGALSFKKLGLINMLPEHLHGTVKFAHRKV